jgi:hypothetical protein
MTLAFDPGDDLADVADGLVPVTVTRPGGSGSTQVAGALRRAIDTRQLEQSGGRYTAGDATWYLPVSQLASPPRLGDAIVDADDQRWTVLEVRKTVNDGAWRCVGRNLAVAEGLNEYIDVEKATYAKSDGGAHEPSWQVYRTGLRARIQPLRREVKDDRQQRTTAATFRVFVAADLDLDHRHRIKGPDGTIYRVAGCRKAERIDALLEVDVVRAD